MSIQAPASQPHGGGAIYGPSSRPASKPMSVEAYLASLSSSYLGLDADLSFIVFAEQIRSFDTKIRAAIQQVRHSSKLRDALAEHIAKLREFRDALEHDRIDHLGSAKAHKHKYLESGIVAKRMDLCYRRDFAFDPKTGDVIEKKRNTRFGTESDGITINDLEREIKRFENQASRLDSDREINMIELNSLISKKANAIQLLSNTENKKHETEKAIINNIR